jgi:hypothetical protein
MWNTIYRVNAYVCRRYLSSIEHRLKLVETRLSSLVNGGLITLNESAVPVTLSNGRSADSTQLETASLRDDSLDNTDSAEDSIDGMGAVTFAQEEDCAFFGTCLVAFVLI